MIYLDSSAITKLALAEPESEALRAYLADQENPMQVTSDLATIEVPRAVARAEPLAVGSAYRALRRMRKVPVNTSVLMSAASLPPATLRSLDAIHLASALALQKHLTAFVSYDQKLLEAATHHDLPGESPTP